MNRNRSYSLPAYEMSSMQACGISDINDPLMTLWASISRPPSHPSTLNLPTIHDDISSNKLWDLDALSCYPTPLDKAMDDFMIPSEVVSQLIPSSADLKESASLFESLMLSKAPETSNSFDQSIPSGRHRSFSMSCTTAQRLPGVEKTIQCPFCDKMFYKKYNLKSHLVSHSKERPFVCQVCDSAFARKHDLQRHLRSLHGLLQTYKCKKCDQVFSRFDALKRHVVQQCT